MTMNYQREPQNGDGEQHSKRRPSRTRRRPAADAAAGGAFDGDRISLETTDDGIVVAEIAAETAYDWEFRSELRRACRETSGLDPDAIVLTSEPGGFSIVSGDDRGDDDFGAEQELQATCDATATLGAPVIAAPRGDVRGYGMALALCSDIRFGGERSQYDRSGVSPERLRTGGVTKRLVATVGRDRAQSFVTAETPFDAETMADWGLLNYVVSDDAVLDEALALASEFADRPTDAYEHMKHAVRAATTMCGPATDFDASATRPDGLTTAPGDDLV